MSEKIKKSKPIPAGLIERRRRVYAQVTSVGEVDDKGKSVLSFGFRGRQVAVVDKPLSTLGVWFIGELLFLARYSSFEAAAEDLCELKIYLDSLKIEYPKESSKDSRETK